MPIICLWLFKVQVKELKNVNINFKIDIGIVQLYAMEVSSDLFFTMVRLIAGLHSKIYSIFCFVANRETAFAHAMLSAGVTYAVSRACKQGLLKSCSCSRSVRPKNLPRDWTWGG